MKPPCEIVVREIIPQIRAVVVSALIKDYGMKQTHVSEKTGITQAAVSQYLSSVRGKDKRILKIFPKIRKKALKIAEHISAGKTKGDTLSYICDICKDIRQNPQFCERHKSFTQLENCKICFEQS